MIDDNICIIICISYIYSSLLSVEAYEGLFLLNLLNLRPEFIISEGI
jgi:hypothetical protein